MSRASLLALALAAVPAGGCSMFQGSHAGFKPVDDADYGRLEPDQMGPIDDARKAVFAARDDVARTKLRIQQAENEIELARADQTAARAAGQRGQAEIDAATSSNDPSARARGQEDAAEGVLQGRSAQAHMAYAQRLVEARQAELDAAEQLVNVREAELERAKLTALTQAGIPAAKKYAPATFDAHVAGAQQDYGQRQADAGRKMQVAQQDGNAWRILHGQYQERMQGQSAALGTAASGTGAGASVTVPPPQPPPAATPNPPPPPQGAGPGATAGEAARTP